MHNNRVFKRPCKRRGLGYAVGIIFFSVFMYSYGGFIAIAGALSGGRSEWIYILIGAIVVISTLSALLGYSIAVLSKKLMVISGSLALALIAFTLYMVFIVLAD